MKAFNSLRQAIVLGGVVVFGMFAQVAAAEGDVKWSGFLNAIGAISDSKTPYLEAIDENGSFDETNMGFNAAARINSKVSVAGQLHAVPEGVVFDWGYAQYFFNDNTTGKAGRLKYPAALVSETIDIGVLNLWVRAPESVYSELAGLVFESYNGAAVNYTTGDELEFSTEFYIGEIDAETRKHKKMLGVVLKVESDTYIVKLAGNTATMVPDNLLSPINDKSMVIFNFSLQAQYEVATIMFEYVTAEIEDNPGLDREGWYITLAHPMDKWTPHFTYQSYETVNGGLEQTGFTLGLNKKLDSSVVLKMEYQQVDPTNGGFFESQPIESSVSFINLSMNMVF